MRRLRVFISAEADPFELFEMVMPHKEWQALGSAAPKGAVVDDNLGFTKDRTISRLLEMQVPSKLLRSSATSPLSCCLARSAQSSVQSHAVWMQSYYT